MTAPTAVAGDEGFPTADCAACGRRIVWAITAGRRKPIPVDELPFKTGNVRLRWEGSQVVARVIPLKLAFGAKGLRLSHFASCPKAHLWTEGRKGGMSAAQAFRAIGRPTQ